MFGDVVRELAPDYVETPEAGADTASGWPPAVGSAWPDPTAVWTGGELGPFEDATGSAGCRSRSLGAVSAPAVGEQRDGAADGAIVGGNAASCDAALDTLNVDKLTDLLVELTAERARVEGRYLAAVGEMTSRYGAQAAAYVLRDQTRMNCAQARSETRLAQSLVLEGFTETLDAMQAGEIHMSHAKVIAREAPKKHRRSEHDFLELARTYPSDTIARHPLANYSLAIADELAAEAAAQHLSPADAELALQRHERSASLRIGDDGMWHLHGKLDFLTGRQLSDALQAAVRSTRRRHADNNPHDDGDAATRAQLTADALCELVLGDETARRFATNLLIIADYDITSDRLANPRLDDGTPMSAQMLAEYGLNANVLPAMFSADWSQLALGRTRNANDAQRLVLAARDRGCIGCELTPEHTQAHHIDYYDNGGLTDIANLASLCEPCHKDVHRHGRKIRTACDGRPRLQPPEPRNADPPGRESSSAHVAARSP
ncbi:HNH endonuclease [Candidatus Poriferisodalis sp.]|uniref:HNH endonuclease signature motif containing protein n=1 Tax=Candidatus Poriferisodalis sp. TaxID=3101277 RepID=UPI003B52AFB4